MGEARRRRDLAAYAEGLREARRDTVPRLREALGSAGGRTVATLEVLPPELALRRPDVAVAAAEAVAAALAVASGVSDGPMAECFGCRAVWRPDLAPAAALVTTLARGARPRAVLLSLLCGACATLPEAGLRDLLRDAVRRDLLPDGEVAAVSPVAGTA